MYQLPALTKVSDRAAIMLGVKDCDCGSREIREVTTPADFGKIPSASNMCRRIIGSARLPTLISSPMAS